MKNKKPKKVIEVSVSTIILVCITLVGLVNSIFLFQTQQTQASPAWLSGWDQRIKITADSTKIDNDLTHFPLTIFLKASNGDTELIFTEVGTNSKKIAVTKADGITQLYVEIEKWDNSTQEGVLHTGLSGDTLASGSDTDYYIYYDNDQADNTTYIGTVAGSTPASNVWDGNFKMVQHMKDDPDTSHIQDSTANNNNGTKKAANEPIESTGEIAKGQDFDGVDDYVRVEHNTDFDVTDGIFTIESMVNLSVLPSTFDLFDITSRYLTNGQGGWDFRLYKSETNQRIDCVIKAPAGGSVQTITYNWDTEIATDTWFQLVFVGSGGGEGTYKIYINGVEKHSEAVVQLPTSPGIYPLEIGDFWYGDIHQRYFNGKIDEVKFSTTARSAPWIKATYNSGNDTLLTYNTEETPSTSVTTEDQLQINQPVTTSISITSPSDITMTPLSMNQNTATASTTWNIKTNNQTGYTPDFKPTTKTLLKS